jgi:streptomycin 6-kinase
VRLIAAGRASEVFDLGDGRILRRFKAGGDPDREAVVMRHAARHGYPVPTVVEVRSDALVLEYVIGRTMAADLRRRPWRLRAHAALLARLHERLHQIEAPPGLPAMGAGDRLLHLDLHPENVLLSHTGPVVIDWTNARSGEPAVDVAMTWLILATSGGLTGRVFLRPFLTHVSRDAAVAVLPVAAGWRVADPNVSVSERDAVRRLVQRARAT